MATSGLGCPKGCPSRVSRVTRSRVDRGQWNVLLEQTEVDPIGIKVTLILQVLATGSEFEMGGVGSRCSIAGVFLGPRLASKMRPVF